jgi:hypothetical protein
MSDTVDVPTCRFCFQTRNTPSNKLISPCLCNGSLQFVHTRCLNMWRRIDIVKNGFMCSVCLSPYVFEGGLFFESIPDPTTFRSFFLRLPILLSIFFQYVFFFSYAIIFPTERQKTVEAHYLLLQSSFHFLFIFVFMMEWSVKNKQQYWKAWRKIDTGFFLVCHSIILYGMPSQPYVLGTCSNICLCMYWQRHVAILNELNLQFEEQLLDIAD